MLRLSASLACRSLLALAVAAALPAPAASSAVAAPVAAGRAAPADAVPGQYVVTLVNGVDPAQVAADHSRRYGAVPFHVYRHALRGFAARMDAASAARAAQDPRVLAVHPDYVVRATAQSVPTGIDRVDGELSETVSGDGMGAVDVDVAVIDTGIDVDHPDLNVVGGRNCSTGKSYDDGNGHGTHVAGTIGAKDDGGGVVGVAPGARLWAVRVLDNRGSGSWSSVICGVDWVTANAATIEVANMSLGGGGSDPDDGTVGNCGTGDALHDAICKSVLGDDDRRPVTYVVAAGNSAKDAKGFVPAAYDEVITVSALADFDGAPGGLGAPTCRSDKDDTFADFSNYGADVDLIAPGVCIRSAWKGGGYNTISGTSMASPHVAGAAALYKASKSGATPVEVKSALQSAGNLVWNDADDPDPNVAESKETLLNVDAF